MTNAVTFGAKLLIFRGLCQQFVPIVKKCLYLLASIYKNLCPKFCLYI
jgi:hypothetical protein